MGAPQPLPQKWALSQERTAGIEPIGWMRGARIISASNYASRTNLCAHRWIFARLFLRGPWYAYSVPF